MVRTYVLVKTLLVLALDLGQPSGGRPVPQALAATADGIQELLLHFKWRSLLRPDRPRVLWSPLADQLQNWRVCGFGTPC
jgi:hypothetical protein